MGQPATSASSGGWPRRRTRRPCRTDQPEPQRGRRGGRAPAAASPCFHAGQKVQGTFACVACQFQIRNRGTLPTCPDCGEIVWAYMELGPRPVPEGEQPGAQAARSRPGHRAAVEEGVKLDVAGSHRDREREAPALNRPGVFAVSFTFCEQSDANLLPIHRGPHIRAIHHPSHHGAPVGPPCHWRWSDPSRAGDRRRTHARRRRRWPRRGNAHSKRTGDRVPSAQLAANRQRGDDGRRPDGRCTGRSPSGDRWSSSTGPVTRARTWPASRCSSPAGASASLGAPRGGDALRDRFQRHGDRPRESTCRSRSPGTDARSCPGRGIYRLNSDPEKSWARAWFNVVPSSSARRSAERCARCSSPAVPRR